MYTYISLSFYNYIYIYIYTHNYVHLHICLIAAIGPRGPMRAPRMAADSSRLIFPERI